MDDGIRVPAFLVGCLGTRLLLAYLASQSAWRSFIAVITATVSLCFAVLWTFSLRMQAPEGGGHTWWAQLRIVHALLYGLAAVLAARGTDEGYKPLLLDVAIGAAAWVVHRAR